MKKLLFWILFAPGCLLITFLLLIEILGAVANRINYFLDRFEYWCFNRKYNK